MTTMISPLLLTFSYSIHRFICRFYPLLCASTIQRSFQAMIYLNSPVSMSVGFLHVVKWLIVEKIEYGHILCIMIIII